MTNPLDVSSALESVETSIHQAAPAGFITITNVNTYLAYRRSNSIYDVPVLDIALGADFTEDRAKIVADELVGKADFLREMKAQYLAWKASTRTITMHISETVVAKTRRAVVEAACDDYQGVWTDDPLLNAYNTRCSNPLNATPMVLGNVLYAMVHAVACTAVMQDARFNASYPYILGVSGLKGLDADSYIPAMLGVVEIHFDPDDSLYQSYVAAVLGTGLSAPPSKLAEEVYRYLLQINERRLAPLLRETPQDPGAPHGPEREARLTELHSFSHLPHEDMLRALRLLSMSSLFLGDASSSSEDEGDDSILRRRYARRISLDVFSQLMSRISPHDPQVLTKSLDLTGDLLIAVTPPALPRRLGSAPFSLDDEEAKLFSFAVYTRHRYLVSHESTL